MTVAQGAQKTQDTHDLVIRGRRHRRYWREVHLGGIEWLSNGQPGPSGVAVGVCATGVVVRGVDGELAPDAARWVALRLIEATAVYEVHFGGDGTTARDGQPGRTLAPAAALPPTPQTSRLLFKCAHCPKTTNNRGSMSVHQAACAKKKSK